MWNIFGRVLPFSIVGILLLNSIAFAYEWDELPIRFDLYIERQNEIDLNENLIKNSEDVIASLRQYNPESSEYRAAGITYDQGLKIIQLLQEEEFYKREKEIYDPDRRLGLCFGRATYLHLQLLRHGVDKSVIKKAFVVGPMLNSHGEDWQFHVGALVRDVNDPEKWWVLDTNIGRPMEVNEWYAFYKKFNIDYTYKWLFFKEIHNEKSLRLYVTDATKIGPSGWEYNIQPGGLFDYNGYFQEMFKSFAAKPIPMSEKFNSPRCERLF